MAQAVDLIVDRAVLFNVGIRRRDVCLGLVVIVIRHKILHRVLREELLELRAELCRKRLVVRQHQRGTVDVGDDVRHRERLARSGHAEQRLIFISVQKAFCQFGNGFRLIAGRLKRRVKMKLIHAIPPSPLAYSVSMK